MTNARAKRIDQAGRDVTDLPGLWDESDTQHDEIKTVTGAKIKAIAPWFGSNRMLAPLVGEELRGCKWVGVPFAGGMAEIAHITAPSIVVGDKHRHVINLATVIQSEGLRLYRILCREVFHPDTLKQAQEHCRAWELAPAIPSFEAARDYFIACWMGRSHKSGIDDEFNGQLSIRWNGNGGDSNTRYRSAVDGIRAWRRIFPRCNFSILDAFEFLARCEDNAKHGLYLDPPFFGPGRRYKHNCGRTESEQTAWHTRLRDALSRFTATRVVCRFYEHPLIRELYPEGKDKWTWRRLKGRKQSNEAAPEVLIINGPSHTKE